MQLYNNTKNSTNNTNNNNNNNNTNNNNSNSNININGLCSPFGSCVQLQQLSNINNGTQFIFNKQINNNETLMRLK